MVLVSSSIFLLIADWESFSLSNSSLRSPGKWIHLFNDVSRDVPAIIRHVVAWIYLKVLAEMLVPSCGRIAPRSKLHYFSPQIWYAYDRYSDPYWKVLPLNKNSPVKSQKSTKKMIQCDNNAKITEKNDKYASYALICN